MTLEEMEAAFEAAIDRPINSELHDFDGFVRLSAMGNRNFKDIIGAAEHDQVWLSINVDWLASVATIDDINYLVDCGIHYDADYDSLYMFV